MDDLYLIHNNKNYLIECQKQIEKKLREIGLNLNKKKSVIVKIQPIAEDGVRHVPIKYLKWNFYITNTNHIIQVPYKKKINDQRRKLRKMQKLWLNGKITTEAVQQSYGGWRENKSKGTSFYIIQKMDNYFRSLFKGVEIK